MCYGKGGGRIMDEENNMGGVETQTEQPEVNYEELYRESANALSDLTAERDSLLSENTELRNARDAALADSAKIKEVNYTLSRQLNIQQEVQRQPENILADMFLKERR